MRAAVLLEQCLAPVPGGTGRYARELAAALAAVAGTDDRVDGYVAWHRDIRAAHVPWVHGPRRLPLPRRALVAAWERGLPVVPRPADVVHATTLLAPPRAGVPLVVTIHDAVPWTHPETLTPRGVAWHRAMAERVARTADVVVVPSAAAAAELGGVLGLGDRLRVIPHGVASSLVVPADAPARRARLGLPREGYLVTLSTLEPRKGLDVAIAALAHPAAPAVPLVVVGQPGWGGVDPGASAAAAGLMPDALRVLGHLDDADVAAVVSGALALVMPSRAEGFGLPALEAMALGTPVVASDLEVLREVTGDAAVLVSPGDPAALAEALAALVADGGALAARGAAGRVRAARFSWERAAHATWAAYRDAAA